MRIALLSPLPPEQTGIAGYAQQLRVALGQAGVDVLTPLQGQVPLTSRAQARAWVSERNWDGVDVVHAELGGGRVSEFLALQALADLSRRPALSATVHDPERLIWRTAHPWWAALGSAPWLPRILRQASAVLSDPFTLSAERALARRLDGMVTLTRTGANALADRMRIPASRVRVIGHGVPTLDIQPLPPLEPIEVLYFGFIYHGKGIEDLIDALGILHKRVPDVAKRLRLTIAGGTAPDIAFGGHDDYLGGLRGLIARQGLTDHVSWNLDLEEAHIAPLIGRHHVMVLPYRESVKLSVLGQMRGTSGSLAWATACGRGVITSDARAFAEEISHGNGVSYRQGQVAELAQRLHELVLRPDTAQQWAVQAVRLARDRAWGVTGARFLDHFQHLAGQSAGRRSQHPRFPSALVSPKELT